MGSLAGMIMAIMIFPQAALAASSHSEMSGLAEPPRVSQIDAANGIVRIQSGTTDDKGKFKAKNTFSGFIVYSDDNGGVYIVTTWHTIVTGQNASVQVTVKNDTTVDAGIEAYSKEQDFCILQAGSLKGKTALPLRIVEYDEEDVLKDGSSVKALGFAKSAAAGTEFSAGDVTTNTGVIDDLDSDKDSVSYIEHTAAISDGLDGGPLVDENGYVIGLNNSKISDDDDYYALDIHEVDKLLDSSGIIHRTRDKDTLYGKLYNMCDSSLTLLGKTKKSSRTALTEAIQKALQVLAEGPYDRSNLSGALAGLEAASGGVELKTSKLLIVVCALGAVIAALLVRLITLILWNRKYEAGSMDGSAPAGKAKAAKDHEAAVARAEAAVQKKAPQPQTPQPQAPQRETYVAPAPDDEATVMETKPAPRRNTHAGVIGDTSSASGHSLYIRSTGNEYELRKNITTLGRSPEADVCFADNKYIARMHAMVENRKGVFYMHDMGTANGIYINGQKIDDSGIRLVPGDIITVGDQELEFR